MAFHLGYIVIPLWCSTRGMDSEVPNPYPFVLLVHWLAQTTRDGVELLSDPPVGASLTSTNVVLMSRQCNGRPR